MRLIVMVVAFCCAYFSINARELGRRPLLGIQVEVVTGDVQRVMNLPEQKGLLIDRVIPASTAEAAGFKKGDVVLSVNKNEFAAPADLIQYVGTQKSGTKFTYVLWRNNKKISGKAVFKAYPKEKYKDLAVLYSQVQTSSGLQRVIITKPKQCHGKLPVVVFLTGIGCYSLDLPLDTSKSELQLLNRLARAGYMTVRIDKPGVGDGVTTSRPCNEIGFYEEAEGYATAIHKLKTMPEVDKNKIYIFGHSMGGVMAPIVAEQESVKGIIAYGTIGANFMEYLLKTRRTIGQALQMTPDSIDAYVKDYCQCAAYYFIENMTTDQAAAKKNICHDYLSVFDYRSRQYNSEMYGVNIPAAWESFSGKALLVWGSSDYVSSKDDHEIIAGTVNQYHPGNATFMTCPATGHGMQYAADFADAANNPGAYNPSLGDIVLDWLAKNDSTMPKHG